MKKYCTNCNTECPDCDGKGFIHRIHNMGIMQTIFQSQCNKCGGEGIIIKGKSNWTDITITLYDPIVPSGAQSVMEWIRSGHESITGRDGYADFYKKNIDFYMLGPVGDKVEQWKLVGAFISSAEFGDVDWSSNEPVMITLTITYDYAILEF